MQYTDTERLLFILLRMEYGAELRPEDHALLANATSKEWKDCMRLADVQGVLALACHAVTNLPEHLRPENQAFRLQCVSQLYGVEVTHKEYCKTIVELQNLLAEHGIGMVVLKGIALSQYYPSPELRKFGDIDIYTYSLQPDKMTDAQAQELTDETMRGMGIQVDTSNYKHSCFKFMDIEIEAHKCFLNIRTLKEARAIDPILRDYLMPETYTFYDKYEISIPSPTFNATFVAFHASHHVGDVLSLYHVCDWAFILKKYGNIIPEEITEPGFLKFVSVITAIANIVMGANVKVEVDSKLTDMVMQDILRSSLRNCQEPKNIVGWLWQRTKFNLHHLRMQRPFYDVSLWKAICNTIIVHLKRIG